MTTPSYPGVDTYGQPLVDAWWTPGWNAQTKAYLTAPSPGGNLPGAPPITTVSVSGSYFDEDGSPLVGFLTFQPSEDATLTVSGKSWRLPARLSGTTTLGPYTTGWGWHQNSSGSIYLFRGQLFVTLMATDMSGLVTDSGQALYYTVIEHFLGGRKYQITVPSGDSTATQDINSLIVAGSVVAYQYDPTNVMADEEELQTPIPATPWNNAGVVIDGGSA